MNRLWLGILMLAPAAADACVGCRQPMVDSIEEPQTIAAGVAFSMSVVTLLILVVVVLAGLTAYIAKTCQRLDREKNPS
ncbi:MAG: hypothetical protein SFU53_04920 [Terrimicrobiaceae bacterium]|nr:hypothetical protein [Terrimicrobiaceae bacterium]